MISLGATPFTELPAHHYTRSCFTKNCTNEDCQESVTIQLSHLWSEERRHEENQFDSLMAELDSIAEELGATTPLNSYSSGSSSESLAAEFVKSRCENERIYSYIGSSAVPPMHAYKDPCVGYRGEELFKTLEEERQYHWIINMNAKVQTLLQEAHQVLESTPPAHSLETSMSKDDARTARMYDGDAPPYVVSPYAQDEGSSFTSEGSTMVEGAQDSCASRDGGGVIESRSDDDWLLGDASTEMTNADCQEFLKEYIHDEMSIGARKLTERFLGGGNVNISHPNITP